MITIIWYKSESLKKREKEKCSPTDDHSGNKSSTNMVVNVFDAWSQNLEHVLSSSGRLFTWTCSINFQSNEMLILFLNILPIKGKVLRAFFLNVQLKRETPI